MRNHLLGCFAFLLSLTAFGQGVVYRIDAITNLPSVDPTILAANEKLSVVVSGYTAAGQFDPRTLRWDAASTNAPDNGCSFDVTGAPGLFVADDCVAGPINARWYGAGIYADSTDAIKAAIQRASALSFGGGTRRVVYLPSGVYNVSSTIHVTNLVMILGEGIEANQVNTTDYPLNGAVIVSTITNGTPVFSFHGTDLGDGNTYSQGWGIENLAIEGTGTEGSGIEFVGNSNFTDVSLRRVLIRGVGGSGIKVGDGTLTGSPRFGYLTWENLTVLHPKGHGFEVYNESFYDVAVKLTRLYVNGAGLSSFKFWNVGGFVADSLVENNSGQLGVGHGFDFLNVHGATFINCVLEGNGRSDDAGSSYVPTYAALNMNAAGLQNSRFVNCIFTAPSGNTGASGAGCVQLISSVATNGFGARESVNNSFDSCRFNSFSPPLAAPSGAVVAGSGIEAGVHRYRVTATYSGGWETPLSSGGELTMVLTTATNVNLSSIPTASVLGSETPTARKIYRTPANGTTFYLLTTISNNVTTTYSDSTADGSLGAISEPRYLIKMDAEADLNYFTQSRFDVMPMVSDAGQWNFFDRMYVGTMDTTTAPWTGKGTFGTGPSGVNQGYTHFYGGDLTGGRGSWITPNVEHGAAWVVPSYASSRFQEAVAFGNATARNASNVVQLGRADSAFSATHLETWTANSSSERTTAGTKHSVATSSGTYHYTPIAMKNGIAYQVENSSGSWRNAMAMDSANVLGVGDATYRINIYPGTDGLYLGTLGAVTPVYVQRQNNASASNPLYNSQTLDFLGSYWDGSLTNTVEGSVRLQLESTNPVYYLTFNVGGADRMQINNIGLVTVSNLLVTGGITLGGVFENTWPLGGAGGGVWISGTNFIAIPNFTGGLGGSPIYYGISGTNVIAFILKYGVDPDRINTNGAALGDVLKFNGTDIAFGTDNTGGAGSLTINGLNTASNINDSVDFRWTASGGSASGALSNTTVTAGSYGPGLLSATVDAKGRLTAIASSLNGASLTNLPGSVTTNYIANIKRDYGAKGDGTTDDYVAFNSAFNSTNLVLYIPPGTYLLTNSITLTNSAVKTVFGEGAASVLKMANSFTNGFMLNTGTNIIDALNFSFDGNTNVSYVGTSTMGTRHGMRLYALGEPSARGLRFANFSGRGIYIAGINDATARPNSALVAYSWATNCQTGFDWAGTNCSEYCVGIGLVTRRCYIGHQVNSANITLTGLRGVDDGYSVYVYPDNGRSHSLIANSTFNHSGITTRNATTGVSFKNNHFMGSTTIGSQNPGFAFYTGNTFEGPASFSLLTVSNVVSGNVFYDAPTWTGAGWANRRGNFMKDGSLMDETFSTNSISGTVTNDARWSPTIRMTLVGNTTLAKPANVVSGQQVDWEFLQDGTGTRTVSLKSGDWTDDSAGMFTINTNANAWSRLRATYNGTDGKMRVMSAVPYSIVAGTNVTLTTNGNQTITIAASGGTGTTVTNSPVSNLVQRLGVVDFNVVMDGTSVSTWSNFVSSVTTNGAIGTPYVNSATDNSGNAGTFTDNEFGISVRVNVPLYGLSSTNYWMEAMRWTLLQPTNNSPYGFTAYKVVDTSISTTNLQVLLNTHPTVSYGLGGTSSLHVWTNKFRLMLYGTATAGGMGGDVISSSNNTFTGVNTFNGQTLLAVLPTAPSSSTNVVLDFQYPVLTYAVTNEVNLIQSTNRPSNATNAAFTLMRFYGDTTNRNLTWNSSWRRLGTNITVIPSNKVVVLSAMAIGSSETNVTFGIAKEE